MRLHNAFVCLRIAAEEQQKLLLVSKAIHISLSLTAWQRERERESSFVIRVLNGVVRNWKAVWKIKYSGSKVSCLFTNVRGCVPHWSVESPEERKIHVCMLYATYCILYTYGIHTRSVYRVPCRGRWNGRKFQRSLGTELSKKITLKNEYFSRLSLRYASWK